MLHSLCYIFICIIYCINVPILQWADYCIIPTSAWPLSYLNYPEVFTWKSFTSHASFRRPLMANVSPCIISATNGLLAVNKGFTLMLLLRVKCGIVSLLFYVLDFLPPLIVFFLAPHLAASRLDSDFVVRGILTTMEEFLPLCCRV